GHDAAAPSGRCAGSLLALLLAHRVVGTPVARGVGGTGPLLMLQVHRSIGPWVHGSMDPCTWSYRPAFGPPIDSVMSFADWLLPLLLITPDDEHGRDPFEALHE